MDIERFLAGQAQIIPAFLPGFDPCQPVTAYQEHNTSQGREPQVQRAQWNERPAAPDADDVTGNEPRDAQAKIQKQSPEPAAAYQMIRGAVE